MTFAQGTSGFVENDMSVFDPGNNQVGTTHYVSTMAASELGGNDYGDWTTVWQNGFAGDVLAIDNVQTGAVPEPAACALWQSELPQSAPPAFDRIVPISPLK